MSEFIDTQFIVLAREFANHLTAAADALEAAPAAQQRVAEANRQLANVREQVAAAQRTQAEAATSQAVRLAKAEADTKNMIDASLAAFAVAKDEHARYVENARGQVETSGARIEALHKEIAGMQRQRDTLAAEIASLKARFADSAAKL